MKAPTTYEVQIERLAVLEARIQALTEKLQTLPRGPESEHFSAQLERTLATLQQSLEVYESLLQAVPVDTPPVGQQSDPPALPEQDPSSAEAESTSPPTAVAAQALAGRRIVVADDNVDVADTLSEVLRMSGADVLTVYGGMNAFDAIAIHHPSIMLLDLGMPGMDGYAVARAIRENKAYAGLTLVALTAWGARDDRRRTLEAGFDVHLVKPADLDLLVQELAKR